MSTGLRLSAERRRLVEQLGPDNFALLARTLRHQDDPGRLERLRGRGDGQEEPDVPIDVQGNDDVVHDCCSDIARGELLTFSHRPASRLPNTQGAVPPLGDSRATAMLQDEGKSCDFDDARVHPPMTPQARRCYVPLRNEARIAPTPPL